VIRPRRTLRLKFIPEEFAFTGFAGFQRQRLALWRDDAFDFSKIGDTACSASGMGITEAGCAANYQSRVFGRDYCSLAYSDLAAD
jgi:hypothetical protein